MPKKHRTKPKPNGSTKHSPGLPTCRYIRCLTLNNVRTFKSESKLDLCFTNGKVAQWTIILGENGTGKTTLLQYIAGMVPIQNPRNPLHSSSKGDEPKIFWSPFFTTPNFLLWHFENVTLPRSKSNTLSCGLNLSARSSSLDDAIEDESSGEDKSVYTPGTWQLKINFALTEEGRFSAQIQTLGRHEEDFAEQFRVIGYGANRHVASPGSPYLGSDLFQSADEAGTSQLFNDEVPLMSPEQWLLGLDHQSKGDEPHNHKMAAALDRAIHCLCGVLPDVSDITIRAYNSPQPAMTVFFHTPFGPVTFAGLSLGYRAAASWIIDFVRRMHLRYPDLPEPEKGPAIVLIDEFDLHMHVRWQMEMMERLSQTFPNTQFIITAHSPLIVQAADGKANIAVLKRVPTADGREEVVIENDPAYVRGWRLDQLVTSDLYGLKSSRAKTYAGMIERRMALMQKLSLSEEESSELRELNDRLDQEAPPDVMPAQQWLEQQIKEATLTAPITSSPTAKTAPKRKVTRA